MTTSKNVITVSNRVWLARLQPYTDWFEIATYHGVIGPRCYVPEDYVILEANHSLRLEVK